MPRIGPSIVLLGFLAVLCGLLAAFYVRRSLNVRPETPVANNAPTLLTVPVASVNLPAGREVTLGDIALLRLTRDQMKKQNIKSSFMTNTEQIMGRVLNADLSQGTTFNTTNFFPEGVGPSIDDQLPDGFRALTVGVEGDDALLGFASAGSWVDVIFRSDVQQNFRQYSAASRASNRNTYHDAEATVTLIERVKILALNKDTLQGAKRDAISDARRPVAVTLAVPAADVAKLRVVDGRGVLSLALRRSDDESSRLVNTPQTLRDVLDLPRESESRMEVYRGRQLRHVYFDREDDSSRRRVTPETSSTTLPVSPPQPSTDL